MKWNTLNVIIIVFFTANIVMPFVLEGSANKWSNGLGWGLAIMWYYIAQERPLNPPQYTIGRK